jgi:hypothetical protein
MSLGVLAQGTANGETDEAQMRSGLADNTAPLHGLHPITPPGMKQQGLRQRAQGTQGNLAGRYAMQF